jgi:hypothetical protein
MAATAATDLDSTYAPDLLPGAETKVWGDSGCQGQGRSSKRARLLRKTWPIVYTGANIRVTSQS